MTNESIKEKLIKVFCKEYQAVWLIRVDDLTMKIFVSDENKSIPHSVETATLLNSYDKARIWYVENYVLEGYKEKILKATAIEKVLAEVEKDESYYVEYDRLRNGEINFNQLCYDKIENDEGKIEYVILGFRDIDMRKKIEFDELTGLLTRTAFFEKAEKLLHAHPDVQYDIILSDIEDFKKVNETYGVKIADKILRWNGQFLSKAMSDNLLIGRYGGDQMVILGEHSEVLEKSKMIGGDLFEEAERKNNLPKITTKIGIYTAIPHDQSIISNCDKAHIALNSIKHKYDQRMALYDNTFTEEIDKKRRIESSMHESLQNGDFKVYYQPKHDAKTGKLVGAEALIRWIHPEYGFMSPADFIPQFEQNGFIVENDKYVWRRTCDNLRRWEEAGLRTVPISANASKLTMASIDIVNDMQIPVIENGLSPASLHLEITETLMEDDVDDLIGKLNKIREAGFEVELDDFGAGFSSINILSTLPIDIVKLDMSFMKQFGDAKRAKVLAGCINLAKELGFQTVSEGVELKEQIELLSRLGVDFIQGYYYSKPLSEEEFEKYLRENQ